ncbi:MAG: hypothetical protein ACKV2U_01120 [Bryobacteraceae bacterium]
MRVALTLLITACLPLAVAQDKPIDKPKNIRVSTWVREDLFAGFLEGDMARHAQGEKKLDSILAGNPNAADAWGWKGGAELLHAVRAYEAGDIAGFEAGYAKAKVAFARTAEIAKQIPQYGVALHAIAGGSFTVFGDRMPPQYRREAWQNVRAHYTALRAIQKDEFDKLPVHFRGEIMAGLAQAAQRLGEAENAKTLTQELATALPGTPYAVFAKRWLDQPETMAKSKVTCATCHDAGRLQAVLNAAPGN